VAFKDISIFKSIQLKSGPLYKVPKHKRFIYMVANTQLSMASYTGYKLCDYERLKGDDYDLAIESEKDSSLNGKNMNFFQLYYYAKRGMEQQNKLKQTQGE